jgi:hypothetical protein
VRLENAYPGLLIVQYAPLIHVYQTLYIRDSLNTEILLESTQTSVMNLRVVCYLQQQGMMAEYKLFTHVVIICSLISITIASRLNIHI